MKTLKKTLCLVLAVVMAVGVLVIPANATAYDDFTDKNDIKHEVAVEVLNALGILTGKDSGAFDPAGNLSRNQAAKIVAYAHGGSVLAEGYAKSETMFNDVPVNGSYTGYINYIAQNGLVGGDGSGNYMPTQSLTGYQLAKMMLIAAGVGRESDYSGSGWSLNVHAALVKNQLLTDLAGVDLSKAITRDDAAQLLFNVMTFSPSGGTEEYVVYDSAAADAGVVWHGSDAITALLMKQSNAAYVLRVETDNKDSLGYMNYGLKASTTVDDFGRSSKSYTALNGDVLVVLGRTPGKSYTTAVSPATIARDMGISSVTREFTINVSIDGGETTSYTGTRGNGVKASEEAKVLSAIGGQGTLTEVYAKSETEFNVYVINTYVAKLTATNIKAAKAATATTDASPAHVEIDGLSFVTSDFKKDDIVIYTKTANKIVSMVKAPSFGGVVTASGTTSGRGYIRVNGNQYFASKNAPTGNNAGAVPTTPGATSYSFYTDSYGNPIYAVAGVVAPEYETGYVYVIARAAKAAGSTGADGLFNTGSATAAQAQAQIIDVATGEIKVVNEALAQDTNGGWYFATPSGAAGDTPVEAAHTTVGKLYVYTTLDNGSYVLIGEAETSKVVLAHGSTSIGQTGKFANASTKVTKIELTKSGETITSAKVISNTGYNSFPAYDGDAVVAFDSTGNLATSILYVADYKAPVTTTYAVYGGVGESVFSNGKVVTMHKFYVNGQAVDYVYGGEGLTVGNAYTVKISGNTVSEAKDVSFNQTKATVTYADETMVVVSGVEGTIAFASNVVIYNAAQGAGYAVMTTGDIEVGDQISYVLNGNKAIAFVMDYGPAAE